MICCRKQRVRKMDFVRSLDLISPVKTSEVIYRNKLRLTEDNSRSYLNGYREDESYNLNIGERDGGKIVLSPRKLLNFVRKSDSDVEVCPDLEGSARNTFRMSGRHRLELSSDIGRMTDKSCIKSAGSIYAGLVGECRISPMDSLIAEDSKQESLYVLRKPNIYPITYTPKSVSSLHFTHQYRFTRKDRQKFCRIFDRRLNAVSRRLLRKMKRCSVVLKRCKYYAESYRVSSLGDINAIRRSKVRLKDCKVNLKPLFNFGKRKVKVRPVDMQRMICHGKASTDCEVLLSSMNEMRCHRRAPRLVCNARRSVAERITRNYALRKNSSNRTLAKRSVNRVYLRPCSVSLAKPCDSAERVLEQDHKPAIVRLQSLDRQCAIKVKQDDVHTETDVKRETIEEPESDHLGIFIKQLCFARPVVLVDNLAVRKSSSPRRASKVVSRYSCDRQIKVKSEISPQANRTSSFSRVHSKSFDTAVFKRVASDIVDPCEVLVKRIKLDPDSVSRDHDLRTDHNAMKSSAIMLSHDSISSIASSPVSFSDNESYTGQHMTRSDRLNAGLANCNACSVYVGTSSPSSPLKYLKTRKVSTPTLPLKLCTDCSIRRASSCSTCRLNTFTNGKLKECTVAKRVRRGRNATNPSVLLPVICDVSTVSRSVEDTEQIGSKLFDLRTKLNLAAKQRSLSNEKTLAHDNSTKFLCGALTPESHRMVFKKLRPADSKIKDQGCQRFSDKMLPVNSSNFNHCSESEKSLPRTNRVSESLLNSIKKDKYGLFLNNMPKVGPANSTRSRITKPAVTSCHKNPVISLEDIRSGHEIYSTGDENLNVIRCITLPLSAASNDRTLRDRHQDFPQDPVVSLASLDCVASLKCLDYFVAPLTPDNSSCYSSDSLGSASLAETEKCETWTCSSKVLPERLSKRSFKHIRAQSRISAKHIQVQSRISAKNIQPKSRISFKNIQAQSRKSSKADQELSTRASQNHQERLTRSSKYNQDRTTRRAVVACIERLV